MTRTREPVITVTTIFAGNQTDRQAFIDLIKQSRVLAKAKSAVDANGVIGYTKITPNCGVHSGMEVTNED